MASSSSFPEQQTHEAEPQTYTQNSQQTGLPRSFTRLESLSSIIPSIRSRSSTLSSTSAAGRPALLDIDYTNAYYDTPNDGDVLTSKEDLFVHGVQSTPDGLPAQAELPGEVMGMTDSFIESLSAKVHPAPVSIGSLSYMFQEFYDAAAVSISDYVSRIYLPNDAQGSDQPLVPMSEILQRKKNRKRREHHCAVLQELVEKKATEAVFDKIWRHSNSEDEARDDALRSKTMALALVGVGLKDLGLQDNLNAVDLHPVCEAIKELNTVKCPNDKITLLKRAHKKIVDVLTALVPSTTSSADHILPVLIYTLIISPPDINITSNLLYIQRFRYHKLVDGEDAYCLTNLEAAISFLETVDMGTLTATEAFTRLQLESDALTSRLPHDTTGHSSLRSPISTPAPTIASVNSAAQLSISSAQKDNTGASLVLGPVKRITYLTPVEFAASAATSAVNTADQSLKTIGNSLENSYKFLFGKLSDKRTELPKTLEDVRKLVGTPTQDRELSKGPIIEDQRALTRTKAGESSGSDTVAASVQDVEKDDGNRRKNITSGAPVDPIGSPQDTTDLQQSSSGLAYTPVADSVRNLGSHLGRFAGNINVIRSFSRTQMNKTPPPLEPDVPPNLKQHPHQDISKLQPPVQRFLETEASDLKIGDIDLLLRDYRRLVTALKNAGAF